MLIELVPGVVLVATEEGNLTRFGGYGYLAGTVPVMPDDLDGRAKILNSPARVDITVLEPVTYEVVARTLSRPDGSWCVPYLRTDLMFTVIGTDRHRQVNSAIQDWISPTQMAE